MLKKMYHLRMEDHEVESIAKKYSFQPDAVLEVLKEISALREHLSGDTIASVAGYLDLPPEKVYGIATFYSMLQSPTEAVLICDSPACWLKGGSEILEALPAHGEPGMNNGGLPTAQRTSCLGLCDLAPAALIGQTQVGPLQAGELPFLSGKPETKIPIYEQPLSGETRILLKHAGEIDPFEITSAIGAGAYLALEKCLENRQTDIIGELEISGLRGRGGAGFPVGRKWRFVADSPQVEKYIICNADESEPLTFKDRVLMDTNPHKILEGMLLAGFAVGARDGFIYIRGEYIQQAKKLEMAIQQAEEAGWLGENIQGTEFSFYIHLHRGAGAYICGEETALIESLEGKRGEPRIRPPYPASFGYKGKPTIVNNVESFAYIPEIVNNGGVWYRSIGNKDLPGTKVYTLVGHVNRPGLFEAPYGLTLREVIEQFGGGMLPGSEFQFALTGGAAGTIVSGEYLDHPIGLPAAGGGPALGSGAMLVCDHSVSVLSLLREVLHFFEQESCGKCTPCRIGTRRSRILLDDMLAGKASNKDKIELQELADQLKLTSFCGLGQSVALPIQSAVNNFEQHFNFA
jgi:NADH:ubiquinone oxidoreductase subunit F (NADH-binding)/NADH:ubiquinone oxidoreductase subunit E